MGTTISMELFKSRFVEVRERCYIFVQDFYDILDSDLFGEVKLPIQVSNFAEMEGRRQVTLFQAILETLQSK